MLKLNKSETIAIKQVDKMKIIILSIIILLTGCGGGGESSNTTTLPVNNNTRPVAVLNDISEVTTGQSVTLNGNNSSDGDNDVLTYEWTLTSAPEGSTLDLNSVESSSSSSYNFTPDVDGAYQIRLTVYDGNLRSSPVTISLSSNTPNRAPVASAETATNALVDETIILDATTSSDPDDDLLTYTWSFVSVPENSNFSTDVPTETTDERINFKPDAVGIFELILTVSDGELDSQSEVISINVSEPNQPPTLSVNSSIETYELMQLELAFSVSDDGGEDNLSVSLTGDDASIFLIEDNQIYFNIIPDFEAPSDIDLDNEYYFTLEVSDDELTISQDIIVSVNNVNEFTETSELPSYKPSDYTRFVTQDIESGEAGTLNMSFSENNNVDGYLPTLNQDDVTLLWNWIFNGEESLTFGVIQNQPEDDVNGPLKEYFYREFEGETYCSNYVNLVCETVDVLLNNFGIGHSVSQNIFNYYQDSDFESTREFYSSNTLLTMTNDDDGIFISSLGNNEAYDVVVVNVERVFNNSTTQGLDNISGVLYVYPPLGIVGGRLNIDSASYFDSDFGIRFHIDTTNLNSTP